MADTGIFGDDFRTMIQGRYAEYKKTHPNATPQEFIASPDGLGSAQDPGSLDAMQPLQAPQPQPAMPKPPAGFSMDYQGGSPDMPQLPSPPNPYDRRGGFSDPLGGFDPGALPPPQPIGDPNAPSQEANAGLLGSSGANGLLGGSGADALSADTGAMGKPWGPMLMALGGGIASGAQFGGGGWGGGIGKGLTLAAGARQDQAALDMRQKAYELQLQELKNQQTYQNTTLSQNEERNRLDRQLRQDKLDETKAQHTEANTQKEAELASPLSIIGSTSTEDYKASRALLTSPRGVGQWTHYWTTGGGDVGRALDPIKRALDGAALIKKVDPKILYDAFLPTGPEDAKAKLDAFEGYMKGLKASLAEANPTQAGSLGKLDAYTTPPENVTPPPGAGPPVEAGAVGGKGTGAPRYRYNPDTGKLELIR